MSRAARTGECLALPGRRRSNRPRNLSGIRDRARQDSLERVPRGATEGAKLSGRGDRRGPGSKLARGRLSRVTGFEGLGGVTESSEILAKLPLDGWHRANGGR